LLRRPTLLFRKRKGFEQVYWGFEDRDQALSGKKGKAGGLSGKRGEAASEEKRGGGVKNHGLFIPKKGREFGSFH